MPNYRRYYIPDSIIFITQVTIDRIRYLESQDRMKGFYENGWGRSEIPENLQKVEFE